MSAKEIKLPGINLLFHVKHYWQETLLITAGGRAPDNDWLRSAAEGKNVHCADRGAAYCAAAGVGFVSLTGDGDSTDEEIYEQAEKAGAAIYRHPPAKDDTDLQLLLQKLPEGDILATGIWSGRFDHLYSNVYSLLNVKLQRQCQVIMADEQECMLLVSAGESVELKLLHTKAVEALSLLPLTEKSAVDFTGVHWPLHKAELRQLYPYSISNVLQSESQGCSCSCFSGSVGLYIKFR